MGIITILNQKEKLYLVIDQGGHATRVLVFNELGKIVCRTESKITTIQSGDLIVEHDSEQMIQSVFNVLDEVYCFLGKRFVQIVDAGIATQRSSFVCWNKKTGQALTPVISWQDRRTVNDLGVYDYAKEIIHEKTGLYLNPHYGATKISWCLNNEKSLTKCKQDNDLYIGPLASFILFHLLAGRPFKIDPANASRTLLMNNKTLAWDDELLNIFNISSGFLPEIVDTKSEFGVLNYKNYTIPLSVCTGDQSAAIFFRGVPDRKSVFVNVGTGAFVQQYCEQVPLLGEEKLLASIVYSHREEKAYVLEGTVNGAARALDWLAEEFGGVSYTSDLDDWSASIEQPPIFINGISGVGSPFWFSNIESRFLSDSSMEGKFVGVLESIVFLIYSNLLAIRKLWNKVEYIQISGGLSQSNAICQKLSDLSGLIIIRDSDVEATALGVYFLLMGISDFSHKPDKKSFFPSKNKLLVKRYGAWHAAMFSAYPR